jgi:Ulp1 family protease
MLPCVQQKDGVSCGIYVIMNAAKIMSQIRSDASKFQFELKHVENPLGIHDKKKLKDVRKLISEYFYKQLEFKNLMQFILNVKN